MSGKTYAITVFRHTHSKHEVRWNRGFEFEVWAQGELIERFFGEHHHPDSCNEFPSERQAEIYAEMYFKRQHGGD